MIEVSFDNDLCKKPLGESLVLFGGKALLGKGFSADQEMEEITSPPEWAFNQYNYCLTISPKHIYKDKYPNLKQQLKEFKKALKNTLVVFEGVRIYGNFEFYGDCKNIHFHGVVNMLPHNKLSKFKNRLYEMVVGTPREKRQSYKPLIDMEKPYKCIFDYIKYCEKHKWFMKKFDISPIILEYENLH